jgi:hypothetical protein
MPDTIERPRSKLFRRNGEKPTGAITERDMALLRYIGHHRLIAADDLALLDGGSQQNVLRALVSCSILGWLNVPRRKKRTGSGQHSARSITTISLYSTWTFSTI